MNDNAFTKSDLIKMTSEPLEWQYQRIVAKIMEAINWTDGNKEPITRLNYPNMMTGEQAVESKSREAQWLKTGCNYRFSNGNIRSKPLGSVSLDTVLFSLKFRDIPICSDYGNIIEEKPNCFKCSKAQRTGCSLCGFGIKFDPERFVRLQETNAPKVNYAFKPMEKGGLGYLEVCEYLNEYCGTSIVIPEVSG